jgi:hypothetical protein
LVTLRLSKQSAAPTTISMTGGQTFTIPAASTTYTAVAYLPNPNTVGVVTITYTGGTGSADILADCYYEPFSTAAPIRTQGQNTSSGTTSITSASLTDIAGDLILDVLYRTTSPLTPGANQTSDNSSSNAAWSRKTAGGGTDTTSWSWSAGGNGYLSALVIKAS